MSHTYDTIMLSEESQTQKCKHKLEWEGKHSDQKALGAEGCPAKRQEGTF